MKDIPDIITFRPSDEDKLVLRAIELLYKKAYPRSTPPGTSSHLHSAIWHLWMSMRPLSLDEQAVVLAKAAGDGDLRGAAERLIHQLRAAQAERTERSTHVLKSLDAIASEMPELRGGIEKAKRALGADK